MYPLSESWYLEGRPDPERKRYLLMAYLHSIRTDMSSLQIAPAYPDIERRMSGWKFLLQRLKSQQALLAKEIYDTSGPMQMTIRKTEIREDQSMDHVLTLLEEALTLGQSYLSLARSCYHDLKKELRIETVGLYPASTEEGYWVLHQEGTGEYSAYAYRLGPHLPVPIPERQVNTTPIATWQTTLVETDAQIMRRFRKPDWPNPAVFRVEIRRSLPQENTIIPLLQFRFASGDIV